MKKERNAFFQNQSSSSYFYPTNQMPINQMNMPLQNYPTLTEQNSNFYQGPVMPQSNNYNNEYINEIETRLAKLERQINRFDMRLSKLESEVPTSNSTTEYNNNNMYMI